jgi:hypothetical protein
MVLSFEAFLHHGKFEQATAMCLCDRCLASGDIRTFEDIRLHDTAGTSGLNAPRRYPICGGYIHQDACGIAGANVQFFAENQSFSVQCDVLDDEVSTLESEIV